MFQFLIDALLRTADLALVTLGLSMLYGLVKFPNIAHVQYAMFGAYASYALYAAGAPLIGALLIASVVTVCALLCRRLGNGRFDRALRLMREEPQLAACMGYDLRSLKSRTLMAGAAITALGGSLYAHYMSFVSPDYMLPAETFLLWTMLMIGGVGSTAGVLIGVLLVQAANVLAPFAREVLGFGSDQAGALRLGLIGLILLACLMWRSEGLVPEKIRKMP